MQREYQLDNQLNTHLAGKGFFGDVYKGAKRVVQKVDKTLKKYKPVSLANKAADAILGKETKEKYLSMVPHGNELNKMALDRGYGVTPLSIKLDNPEKGIVTYKKEINTIVPKQGFKLIEIERKYKGNPRQNIKAVPTEYIQRKNPVEKKEDTPAAEEPKKKRGRPKKK